MYYIGTPFIEKNSLKNIDMCNSYFRETIVLGKIKAFEYFINQNIKLIIYQNILWNNEDLVSFHKRVYPNILYHTEELLTERCIKTIFTEDYNLKGYNIFHYDEQWQILTEQWYDEYYKLVEYRQLKYLDDIIKEEQIFDPKRWKIDMIDY